MDKDTWTAVDRYVSQMLIPPDPILDAVLRANEAAVLPPHHVSPSQGKLLYLLARLSEAGRILEIGTLGGYSTIWLGRALPANGRLITLEADPAYAEVARANIARADLASIIEVVTGEALDTIPKLLADGRGPFDLIFIDADKRNNPGYFTWALKLSRPGSLIVADNVVRGGALIDGDSDHPHIRGVRRFHELLAAEPRVSATTIQTVGSKGYDGFTLAVVAD